MDIAMKVVVLTGAGISAESGIPTFRSPVGDGLWDRESFTAVSSAGAFDADPARVHAFYNRMRGAASAADIAPNAAHDALARLEEVLGDDLTLITQNIDDLHERAGSSRVVHMHGELGKLRSTMDPSVIIDSPLEVDERTTDWRPHVVWFGEPVLHLRDVIAPALEAADVFVAIGTSSEVPPAAHFVLAAAAPRVDGRRGANAIEVNLEDTVMSSCYDVVLRGPATSTVPDLVHYLTEVATT